MSRLAVPLLERLVRDLSFDEQLREFAALRLALEWHGRRLANAQREGSIPAAPEGVAARAQDWAADLWEEWVAAAAGWASVRPVVAEYSTRLDSGCARCS